MSGINKEAEALRQERNAEWRVNLTPERIDMYKDQIDEVLNIRYADGFEQYHLLDVYSPKGAGDKKLPVAIVIHGGGYFFCEKETNLLQARWFAANGFRVVNMDYRLFPEVDCRGIEQDVFAVFKWVEEHAEEFHFDLTQVGITGDSAGGHCILLTTLLLANKELRELYGVPELGYEIKHYAACCPGTNVRVDRLTGNAQWNESSCEEQDKFTFDIKKLCETYKMPRIFLFCTPTDGLCYDSDIDFEKFLNEKGIDHVFKEYVGTEHTLPHVFNVTWPEWVESQEANTDVKNYFLDK